MTRIAGTQRPVQKQDRLRDPDYRAHVRALPCLVCGRSGQVEAAHITIGNFTRGKKPPDDLCIPLCGAWGCKAHSAFDAGQINYAQYVIGTPIHELKKQARGNYKAWKQQQEPLNDAVDD